MVGENWLWQGDLCHMHPTKKVIEIIYFWRWGIQDEGTDNWFGVW